VHIKVRVEAPDNPLLAEFLTNSLTNHSRVEHLVRVYERETKETKGRRNNAHLDILRSAVVFIHATLEDGMRVATRIGLPRNCREVIDKIPLVGLNESGNVEKFFLGRLTEHMDKTVKQLIDESIDRHLERISYTSVAELAGWLKVLEVDVNLVQSLFPTLDLMMKRRHHIVHRGDRSVKTGPGQQFAQSLSARVVRQWNEAVGDFLGHVLEAVMSKVDWPDQVSGALKKHIPSD